MGKEGKLKIVLIAFILILLALPFVFSGAETLLDIPNSPPELSQEIPNQSWQRNTNLISVFDLDDYFEDAEGELIKYTYSNLTNITINLDENNLVSFIPDSGFIGTRMVRFYAHDFTDYGESNLVYLSVGIDTEAPEWFNAIKDKVKVYQNDYVTFNVTWKDNFALSNYTFYLHQENVWTEFFGYLNGTLDYSSSKVQISAPAGKIVQWKVCASDTSLNTACTEIFEFDVLVKPVNPPNSQPSDSSSSLSESDKKDSETYYDQLKQLFTHSDESDFSFNVNSFLINLKQGTGTTKIFEITNIGNSELNFSLSVEGLEKYVDLSEISFNLSAGATKRITLDFKVGLETVPGEYLGVLVVDSFKQARIPLLININEINLEFEVLVSVLEDSKSVKPGKRVFAKIELKNLKDQFPVDVLLYYAVKDFQGNIYNFNEENVTFGDNLILERFLNISEDMPLGNYVFYSRVYNEKDSSIHSDEFQVGYSFKFAAFVKASSIFILVFFLSFILFFFVIKYRRQKDKGRVLNLYVKLNELKGLVKEGKFEDAAKIYIGIKRTYGENIPGDLLENKQKLAESIKILAGKINFNEVVEEKKGEGKIEEQAGGEKNVDIKKGEEGGKEISVLGEKKEFEKNEGNIAIEKEKGESNNKEKAQLEKKIIAKVVPIKKPILAKPVLKKVVSNPIQKKFVVAKTIPVKQVLTKPLVNKKIISKPLVKPVVSPKIISKEVIKIKKEEVKNEN